MTTDIIVPVFNLFEYTKLFIESLKLQEDFHLIIIDNASIEPTKSYLENLNGVELIRNDKNLGYVKAINQGLKISKSESILLGNNDIILTPHLLIQLREALDKYDIVAPFSNNINEQDNNKNSLLIPYKFTSIENLFNFSKDLEEKNRGMSQEVDFVYGHCLMMKRSVFLEVGYLDESFGIGNYDDLDYCRRARNKGKKIGLISSAFVYHFCHATFKEARLDLKKIMENNKEIFDQKWA